jgi:hypothetical protein
MLGGVGAGEGDFPGYPIGHFSVTDQRPRLFLPMLLRQNRRGLLALQLGTDSGNLASAGLASVTNSYFPYSSAYFALIQLLLTTVFVDVHPLVAPEAGFAVAIAVTHAMFVRVTLASRAFKVNLTRFPTCL